MTEELVEYEARVRAVAEDVVLDDLLIAYDHDDLDLTIRDRLARFGAVVVTDCYQADGLAMTRELLMRIENAASQDDPCYLWQGEAMWAIWNLFEKSGALMRLCLSPGPFTSLAGALEEPMVFARCTAMKKEPGAQQTIGWHQDLATTVDRELNDDASKGIRAGVPHRDVSAELYKRMISVRINVEPQYADGGCLQIIPGSHIQKLGGEEGRAMGAALPQLLCPVPAGSILIYRPLLIHASGPNSRAVAGEHRRVIHTEFRPLDSKPDEVCEWYDWQNRAVIHPDHIAISEGT